ncbi:MAG: peroxide stress protein YaaA [Phascolarctobacterium faecium]
MADGIQYQYMAPRVFENAQPDYVAEHLNILSGFYGILKAMDGVVPYRLRCRQSCRLPV